MSPQSNIGFAARVAALYAAIFAMIGVQLPFLPVWLKAKGLDAQMIGVVLAIPMVVRIFAIPLATRMADRRDALRAAIVIAGCASVIAYGLVGLAEGVLVILFTYALAALVFTPVMPLADTYALRGLGERALAYGPVRLWGSAAFIVGTYVAGYASDIMPARQLIWLVVAVTALIAVAALTLSPLAAAAAHPPEPSTTHKSLLRDPAFVAVLASASLIQASHAVFYSFASLEWRAAQLDGTTIAGLWTIGVVAEIVLFAMSGRLPPMIRPTTLLMVGAAGAALRWTAMALDPPALLLPFLQTLHALVIRRELSRRALVCRAPGSAGAGSDRARLPCRRVRRGHGGGDGVVRAALRGLRRGRLRGNGASGDRWRRLRGCSAPNGSTRAALNGYGGARAGCRRSARCRQDRGLAGRSSGATARHDV